MQGFVWSDPACAYRGSHASIHHPPCMAVGRHKQAQDMAMVVIVAGLWHESLSLGKTSPVANW